MSGMKLNQFPVQASALVHRDAVSSQTGVAKLGSELRREPFGSVIVLEGAPSHRLQLAQALASHLGYRINLGAVVSKYIGETEKNLDNIFSAANHSDSILFFDEADALFGKRTDVKDSHDRYANMFTNLPSFQGLLMIGVDKRHNVPTHRVPRSRVIAVSDYWPPR